MFNMNNTEADNKTDCVGMKNTEFRTKKTCFRLILVLFVIFYGMSETAFAADDGVNKTDVINSVVNLLQALLPLIAGWIAWIYNKTTKKKLAEGVIAKVLNTGLAMAKQVIEKPVDFDSKPEVKKIYEKNLMTYATNFVATQKENDNDFKKSLKQFGKNVLKDFGNDLIQENLERLLQGKKLGLPKIKFKFSTRF